MTKIIKCLEDVQCLIVQIVEKSCPISHFPRMKKGNVCVPVLIARAYLNLRGSRWWESWLNAELANLQLSQVAWATTDPNETCWKGGLFRYCINGFVNIANMVTNSLNHPLQTEWVS